MEPTPTLNLAPTDAPTSAGPSTPTGAAPIDGGLCPICRAAVAADKDAAIICPGCRAPHHADCWEYNAGCGAYGCTSAPLTKKLADIEVPLSFWGQTEKTCPACQKTIQAAAVRCRHCGTVFVSARPQEAVEFNAQSELQKQRPKLRRTTVLLLIFGIFPFTAAITAVGGGIWYLKNRRRLATLPASQAAIAKIAVLIALGQTILLALAVALYARFG